MLYCNKLYDYEKTERYDYNLFVPSYIFLLYIYICIILIINKFVYSITKIIIIFSIFN